MNVKWYLHAQVGITPKSISVFPISSVSHRWSSTGRDSATIRGSPTPEVRLLEAASPVGPEAGRAGNRGEKARAGGLWVSKVILLYILRKPQLGSLEGRAPILGVHGCALQ